MFFGSGIDVNRMFEVVCEVGNGVLRDKDCQSPVV